MDTAVLSTVSVGAQSSQQHRPADLMLRACMQRLAGETVALEERVLAAKSNELRARREAEGAAEQQQRAGRQLARAQAEAGDLSATVAAMQAGPTHGP